MSAPEPPEHLQRRIDRLRARRQELDEAERARTTCPHDQGTSDYVAIFADGSKHLYAGCRLCGHNISRRMSPVLGRDRDGLPIGEDRRLRNPPCAVCGSMGTQLHHFAPRHIFGDEADLWPTAYLCPDCHAEWHQRVERR